MLRTVRMKEQDFKDAEKASYDRIFKPKDGKIQEVPQMQNVMLDAINRIPNAVDVISARYKTAGNLVPPFKMTDSGAIEWTRIPTIQDAEILRRTLDKEAGKLFKSGDGDMGSDLVSVERQVRGMLDNISPDLKSTRANWARMNSLRDTFEDGRKAFNKPPEQLEIDFQKIIDDPELVASFREGVMAQINNKLARTGSKQLMKKLTDVNTLEGKLFDTVFPEGLKRDALNSLIKASRAQSTYEKVIEGSTTQLTKAAGDQSNLGIGMDELLGAARMNPVDIARVGGKIVKGLAPNLTDVQRKQITDILISQDAETVRKALTDDSAMARLQNQIKLMSIKLQASAKTAGAVTGGLTGSQLSGQFFGE